MALDNDVIQGADELDRRLKRLGRKDRSTAMRRARAKSLTVIRKGIVAEVPVATTPGHSAKSIKRSIGTRNKKSKRSGEQESKAGVKVGKKRKSVAPHAHLIALGTKPRVRKSIGGKFAYLERGLFGGPKSRSTGAVRPDDFVGRGFRKTRSKAASTYTETLKQNIEKFASKRA